MRHRLKYVRNAPDGNGTLVRGDMYKVGIKWLLGGTTGHRLWERKTTKQYTVGTRMETPDGRVFRYVKASGTLQCDYPCKFCNNILVAYSSVALAQAVNDKQVTFTVSAGASGEDSDGIIDKDELEGGYVSIFKAGLGDSINRCITGNTALAIDGTSIIVYLDDPLDRVLTTSDHGVVLGNPWNKVADLHAANDDYASVAGYPNVPATDGEYCWIQTWGPRWVSSAHAGIGGAANEREAYFCSTGVDELTYSSSSLLDRQHAGFLITKSSAGTDVETFLMLQISP